MFKRVSTKCAPSSWGGGGGFGLFLMPNGWGEGGMNQPFFWAVTLFYCEPL
jgi:hypothetical protein